jgi:glycosyltransferase involved in cell wall biosynthesis
LPGDRRVVRRRSADAVKLAFWVSVGFVAYAYFGYPLLLAVLGRLRPRPVNRRDYTPRVSFIVTVHDEEKRIRAKIENTLGQAYPRELLEIIVASDASGDATDDIVGSFASGGVQLVRMPRWVGKENAQKAAIAASTGEVLIFSDAGTLLEPDGVATIVRNFADPSVGCVSSTDRVVDDEGRVRGEGLYVRYEMLLRSLETRLGTLVGLSGSCFAARRSVCRDWAIDVQSDFGTLLNAVRRGFRGVSDPRSVGYYRSIASESKEYDRKVRTVLRGIVTVTRNLDLFNPLRYPLFAWQLASHKMCRWLVPFALIVALGSNAFLLDRPAYRALFLLQGVFYGVAALGNALGVARRWWPIGIPAFLVMTNLSIASAWYCFARGQRMTRWKASER